METLGIGLGIFVAAILIRGYQAIEDRRYEKRRAKERDKFWENYRKHLAESNDRRSEEQVKRCYEPDYGENYEKL